MKKFWRIYVLLIIGACILASCSNDLCPSGESVIVRSSRKSIFSPRQIYVVNSDGSGVFKCKYPMKIVDNPAWSPDGNWIAYDTAWEVRPNLSQLYVIDTDNSKRIQITSMDSGAHEATWSSDSKRIAFESIGIYTLSVACLEHGIECVDTPEYLVDGLNPAWSPDGTRIVFQRKSNEENRSYEIFVMYINNPENLIDITPIHTYGCSNPVWSPDSRRIATSCKTDGRRDIFIIDLESTTAENITNSPNFLDSKPQWSLDGKRIAFISTDDYGLGECINLECSITSNAVFVINSDGTNKYRLTHHDEEFIQWIAWMP